MVCLKVAIKSALLGNMHPEVGATLHNMGTVAYLLAQYEIAARVWLQVLRHSPTSAPRLLAHTRTAVRTLRSDTTERHTCVP